MYCPQCATPNADNIKFCRSCGTELEAVALAISGKHTQPIEVGGNKSESKTTQDWLEKHSEGVRDISTGTVLLVVSLLIGIAMALFLPASFDVPWILIWTVFFGWMACWGGIALASGIGDVIVSKSRLRLMELAGKKSAIDAPPLSSAGELLTDTNASAFRSSPPLSVTEGTTRHLEDLKVEK